MLFFASSYSSYGQRYWISVAAANWNNTANWSTTSGGAGGASVPGSSDLVIFNSAGAGNCTFDMIPTVAGITVSGYTSTIDLNGNNLTISGTANNTFSSGTITNSSATSATLALTTSGITTFSGTTFGVSTSFAPVINCVAAQVLLHGSTFYGTTTIAKTGATANLGNGGNVFHGVTTLSNSGSAYFATGYTTADTFNDDLTLTNTGSSFVALADNTAGNMFNGNIIVNSNAGVGVVFGNGPGSTMSSTLASGKTITVGGTGFSAGKLQLKSFTQLGGTAQSLTFTGTGSLQLGPSSTFNGAVTFTAPQILLHGCTYNSSASLTKNGASNNLGNGGNTFAGTTMLVNSGSGYFATGYTTADTFNGDITATNTGTGWIALSDNATGTTFNENIIVNSTSATTDAGITFGNGTGTAVTATLAAGKTISVGSTGFTAGRLLLRRFTQLGTTAQSFTLTGTSIAYLGPYSTFNGGVNFISSQVYLNGCTYNSTAYIEKNGATSNAGTGGNTFNGATTLLNSGSGWLETATTTADTFNGDVTLTNTGSSLISIASSTSGNAFNGNIVVNSTAGLGIKFANNTTSGAATLASGQTITAGGTGFTAGTLTLQKFTQSGTTAQSLTLTGTATLTVGSSSVFNGNVNFVGPRILLNGCTYNGTATITKNGATTINCDGGNIFNSTTSLTNNSTAIWLLANTTSDTFNGPVTFSQTSSGALQPAYNGTNSFYDNLTVSSASVITFGSGTGVVQFAGSNNQTITSASSIPIIQRLTMSKTSATNSVTLNTPVNIGVASTLTNGIVSTTSTNYLNFVAGSSYTGGSSSSYIDGPVRKTGNTAFTFPTGNNSIYRTIAISAPGSSTDAFTAQYFKADQSYGGVSTYDPSFATLSGCEYWTLDRTTGSSNVNVTLSWNTSDCTGDYITDPSTLLVARWNGSSWASHGNGGTTGTASTGTITTSAAVTSFSPFTLASASLDNPLPVELLFFTGRVTNKEIVELLWATASELNSDYFGIEHSEDGLSFLSLGKVKAAGTSNDVHNYLFEDSFHSIGRSYYRLKQVDFDGQTSYSDVVKVDVINQQGIKVYPNPVTDHEINLVINNNDTNTPLLVKLLDNQQRELFSQEFEQLQRPTITITLPNYVAAGIYFLSIANHTGIYYKKIIIK